MTYGDVTGRMREHMIWLLERHRIQQRIGGGGSVSVPVTTTEAQRAEIGAEITRYRDTVLVYCRQAIAAAAPVPKPVVDSRHPDPVETLRRRLDAAAPHRPTDATPLSEILTEHPEFELVATWRNLARTAVEGEREVALLRRHPLTTEQATVVLKDTADLVRGLVILDRRHERIPGWRTLPHSKRLLDAAEALSSPAHQGADHSVDDLGWRTTPGRIAGPALPGLAGVLQAQYNVAVDLTEFPSATNLRQVLIAQAQLSGQAAKFAGAADPVTAAAMAGRASLYQDLAAAARTVGGEVGDGRLAALESANAAQRIRFGPTPAEPVGESLKQLAHLSDRVDARVSTAVEHGFREKLYFTAVNLDHLGPPGRDGIQRPAQTWAPVDAPQQSALLSMVHRRLRPVPPMMRRSQTAATNGRAALEQSLKLTRGASRAHPMRSGFAPGNS